MTDKARLVLLPEGWVAVPDKATYTQMAAAHDGPLGAGEHVMDAEQRAWLSAMYEAFIAAAPSLPEPDTAGSREAFEAWAKDNGYRIERAPGLWEYDMGSTSCAWKVWQAAEARMQAREEQIVNACKRQLELQQRIGRDECCLNSIQRCIHDMQKLVKDDDK